ncbi:MAG: TlpA family protein disulfide reductase [Synergistaceae bacterium]|nr:TlpA family protein disulfide reductase [Synergistaceae bacterium]MBQ7570180.1 TlpA family protein disulfide reductase [Synergistaceae bacterium]MBR0096621.1 TlpA family protein disulfide reductase [Synergistaceae bacterium]MBR0220629.1 TlpA family protein disulfide reductase [Synergistaceae bacterium]
MLRNFIFACALIFIACGALYAADDVIEFQAKDLDGNIISSSELFSKNKITMINLWGLWCPYCVRETGELAELHKKFQAKGCGIIGIEAEPKYDGKTLNASRKFLQDEGAEYPNVLMPEGVKVFEEVIGYPTSFFVDNTGKILGEPIVGAQVTKYEPTLDVLLANLDEIK